MEGEGKGSVVIEARQSGRSGVGSARRSRGSRARKVMLRQQNELEGTAVRSRGRPVSSVGLLRPMNLLSK